MLFTDRINTDDMMIRQACSTVKERQSVSAPQSNTINRPPPGNIPDRIGLVETRRLKFPQVLPLRYENRKREVKLSSITVEVKDDKVLY